MPMRSICPESSSTAVRYSFSTIDFGIFQIGLSVIDVISADITGVGDRLSPTTILVCQTIAESRTTLSVKSGILTMTWLAPSSRGIQRQRSMLTTIFSITASRRDCSRAALGDNVLVFRNRFLALD